MTKIQQLIDAVKTAGADLQAKGTKLQLYHPDKVSPELKSQLREKKPEILWELTKEAELEESLRRLEASAVCLAVWDTGDMRVLVSKSETGKAIADGGTVYSPEDMYRYVITLTQRERRMLHSFKRAFGGSVEWRENQ